MKKYIIGLFALVALAGSLYAGCGGSCSKGEAKDKPAETESSEEV